MAVTLRQRPLSAMLAALLLTPALTGLAPAAATAPDRNLIIDFVWYPLSPTEGEAVFLEDRSHLDGATGGTWTYTFEPNTLPPKSGRYPEVRFPSGGEYAVTLTVRTTEGQTANTTRIIQVNARPVADFTTPEENPLVGIPIAFTDTSTDDEDLLGWSWDFDGEATSSLQHPTHTFTTLGTKRVSLTVTDVAGATSTRVKHIGTSNDNPVPAFDFSPNPPLMGQPVYFRDASTDAHGTAAWEWHFSGTATRTEANPIVTFTRGGDLPFFLTVTDPYGYTASDTFTIRVYAGADRTIPIGASLPDGTPVDLNAPGVNLRAMTTTTGLVLTPGNGIRILEDGTAHALVRAGTYLDRELLTVTVDVPHLEAKGTGSAFLGSDLPSDLGIFLDAPAFATAGFLPQTVRSPLAALLDKAGYLSPDERHVTTEPQDPVRLRAFLTWADGTPVRDALASVTDTWEGAAPETTGAASIHETGPTTGSLEQDGSVTLQVPQIGTSPWGNSGAYAPGLHEATLSFHLGNGRPLRAPEVRMPFEVDPTGRSLFGFVP